MIKYKVIWMWSGGNNIIITPIPRGHVYSWILWKLRITSKAEFCGFIWLSRSRFWLNYDSYHRFFFFKQWLSKSWSISNTPTNQHQVFVQIFSTYCVFTIRIIPTVINSMSIMFYYHVYYKMSIFMLPSS